MTARGRWAGVAGASALLLVLTSCAITPSTTAPHSKLLWSDEFSGASGKSPDASKWNFITGGQGFGNNELQCYTSAPGNASLNGSGDLVITAIKQPGHICDDGSKNDFTSARLTTENKFDAKYGRLEIRAKVPTTSGTWPAFWALGSNQPQVGWPATGEIDVMEVIGKHPSVVFGTVHGPRADGTPMSVGRTVDTGHNLADAFHVFRVDWTPTKFTYALDGVTYATITKADVEKAGGKWVYSHRFYLLVNLAVGGNNPGNPTSDAPWPQSYTIDYVRVYN